LSTSFGKGGQSKRLMTKENRELGDERSSLSKRETIRGAIKKIFEESSIQSNEGKKGVRQFLGEEDDESTLTSNYATVGTFVSEKRETKSEPVSRKKKEKKKRNFIFNSSEEDPVYISNLKKKKRRRGNYRVGWVKGNGFSSS